MAWRTTGRPQRNSSGVRACYTIWVNGINQPQQGMQLFDAEGRRLYFTEEKRRAFLAFAAKAPREVRTFCGTLHGGTP